NREIEVDDECLVNGRRLTNLGTFRAYVAAYLENHPQLHRGMTLLVRQLAPSDHGIPIELYVFSAEQAWIAYEGIQGDIFDHLIASVREFDLRVFQNPTGRDLERLAAPAE
ncbi:MAG: mechanosensitive ion channel family protein, partial [Planctomycetota bacterium]